MPEVRACTSTGALAAYKVPDKHLAIADNANASINMRLGVQARHAALQQELKDSVPQFMEGQPFDLTASPSSLQRYAQDSWRLTNSLAALGGRSLYACSLDCCVPFPVILTARAIRIFLELNALIWDI